MRVPITDSLVCQVELELAPIAPPIGPAGDTLYLPLRITGGTVAGRGGEKRVSGGADLVRVHPDETLSHCGMVVASDRGGDIVFRYGGNSEASEGAYDELLDLRLPGRLPTRLVVRLVSTNPSWRFLNRRPLAGVGSVDLERGRMVFTLHAFG